MNHNEVLGVPTTASAAEIQQAFRKAALEQHPDHSNSPEAAEAFARIKVARDELIKRAATQEVQSVQQATAAAVKATATAAFTPPPAPDPDNGLSPEEIEHIQKLDELAFQKPKYTLFGHTDESAEVKQHRKKLKTNTRRLQGLY